MLGLMGFSGSLPLYVIHRYYIFVFIDRANKDACLLACSLGTFFIKKNQHIPIAANRKQYTVATEMLIPNYSYKPKQFYTLTSQNYVYVMTSMSIYMKQPTGFPQKGNEDLVCKLEKGLYGLKQSARCWYQLLNDYLQKTEYQQCPSDPRVYWKRVGSAVIIIAIHVDELIIASNEPQMLKREKEVLSRRFAMHDLGEAHFILGMKITRDRKSRRLWLTQGKYLSEVIEKFGMKDCKIIATPQEMGQRLEKNDDNPVNIKEYQALIGSLTYAAMSTRPDITEALSAVSQFASNPNETHWKAAKRILQTKSSLPFCGNPVGCFMYISCSSFPFKKAVCTSI